ncbi:MAG: helix-hairpin-helix domain-containing protein [Candidatus Erginobacter occultus]|nr:helix-hairpin-helix domain-containing protein [Candidatus Erginobacter occultus]
MKKQLAIVFFLALSLGLSGGINLNAAEEGRLDVNTAGSDELQTLEGVGPRVAMKFIAERQSNGPYLSLEDLQRRVLGVDDRMLDSLRRQGLYAGPPGGS